MKASKTKHEIMKILESDLLIDKNYPQDPILQKCFVWYVVFKQYAAYDMCVISQLTMFSEESQSSGLKWHKGLGLDTLVTRKCHFRNC